MQGATVIAGSSPRQSLKERLAASLQRKKTNLQVPVKHRNTHTPITREVQLKPDLLVHLDTSSAPHSEIESGVDPRPLKGPIAKNIHEKSHGEKVNPAKQKLLKRQKKPGKPLAAQKIVDKMPKAKIVGKELLAVVSGPQIIVDGHREQGKDNRTLGSEYTKEVSSGEHPHQVLEGERTVVKGQLDTVFGYDEVGSMSSVAVEKPHTPAKSFKSCMKKGKRVNKSVYFNGGGAEGGSEVTSIFLYEAIPVPIPWPVLPSRQNHHRPVALTMR